MQSKSEIDARMEMIGTLTDHDNWNGYGAKTISSETIKGAKSVIKLISKQPVFVTATGTGAIQLEWHNKKGTSYLELEIHSDGSIVGFAENKHFHEKEIHYEQAKESKEGRREPI